MAQKKHSTYTQMNFNMKVLLLGDFSSAQYNLKLGLEQLGHQVTLVSHRDGFKKTPTDVEFYLRKENENKYLGAAKEIFSQIHRSRMFKGYDIIQTAAHLFFHNRIDKFMFPRILENNHRAVMFHAACSEPYNRFVRTLRYSPCVTCKRYDLPKNSCDHEKENARDFEYSRYEQYHAIVSSHFEYYKAFESTRFGSKNHFIPIPIKSNEVFTPIQSVPEKLNVYYGEIRKGFKGGTVIEEAIQKVKSSSFGKHFQFTVSRKLPYQEYLKVISESHILIDQANSYSYGVNALVGMSKGKIVLSGAEPEVLDFMGITAEKMPIINIKPNVDDIFNKLIMLFETRAEIPDRSDKSIRFVQEHHDPLVIAQKYSELYASL